MTETESSQNPNVDENDDEFSDSFSKIQQANTDFRKSVRARLSKATEENSQLKGENRRCEELLELAHITADVVERELEMMTQKKTEVQSQLEEQGREISTLKLLLDEKETVIQKLRQSLSLRSRDNANGKTPNKAENRFEKPISSQLKRERAILKASPLATKDEPLTKRSRAFSGASVSTSASSKTRSDEERTKPSSSSNESGLNVPEIYRINYGFTNNSEIENCPHARDFWYDSDHSTVTKFLIRLYDDREYQRNKLLHVKQQKKLEEPKIKHVELKHIEKQFETLSKKSPSESESGSGFRLWLDVRDFNIFSSKFLGFFKQFGRFVTHFSFGRRLFSFDEISASQLLSFLLDNFPNLEYLAINDGMLKKMDQPLKISSEKKLEKLKTIQLMTTRFRIDTPLIIQLLLHAPALQQIYGIPLHCVSEVQTYFERAKNSNLPPWCKKQKTGANEISLDFVKELTVIRNIYDEAAASFHSQKNFLADILSLCHLNPPLEVVDVRTYFIRDSAMREVCVKKWSQLLNSIKNHVKSLKIEPYQLKNFPRLEYLQSLHFEIDIRHLGSNLYSGYFPPGFDFNTKFPQLKTVEIGLDERSSQFLKGDEKKSHNLFQLHFPRDVFRRCDVFSRVERLNLVNFAPPTCFLDLEAIFPRITMLQLTLETVEMSNALPMIYKFWPGLKQLILNVNLPRYANYNLDSAFTGMHFSNCRILERQIREKDLRLELELDTNPVEETIRKYKNKSSIQDLKDLTLLKIVLNWRETNKDYELADCLMTPVSGIYGFGPDQMPDLKVVVAFNEKMTTADKTSVMELLKPMKSYLTIDN